MIRDKINCKKEMTKQIQLRIWLRCDHPWLSFWRGATVANSNPAFVSHVFQINLQLFNIFTWPARLVLHRASGHVTTKCCIVLCSINCPGMRSMYPSFIFTLPCNSMVLYVQIEHFEFRRPSSAMQQAYRIFGSPSTRTDVAELRSG